MVKDTEGSLQVIDITYIITFGGEGMEYGEGWMDGRLGFCYAGKRIEFSTAGSGTGP